MKARNRNKQECYYLSVSVCYCLSVTDVNVYLNCFCIYRRPLVINYLATKYQSMALVKSKIHRGHS